jgi:hypothetical protein
VGVGKWEIVSTVVRQLQTAAKETNIPWIVSTQLGGGGSRKPTKEGATIRQSSLRYAQEWFMDANIVIALNQTDTQRINGIMELQTIKIREGVGGDNEPIFINWDQSDMNFDELGASAPKFSMPKPLSFGGSP